MIVSPAVARWARRAEGGGLAPFGRPPLGEAYNRGLFLAKARALASAIRREALPLPARRRCLDAGVGHGWLLEAWRRQGVGTIAGIEAVPEVAARARRKAPSARIGVADLSAWRPSPGERYDLVCALDVLFYLTEDADFARALEALAEAVAPGGLLAVSDTFAARRVAGEDVVNRPWAHYARVLRPVGLAPLRRRGFFVLANAPCPVDAGGTLWQNALHPPIAAILWNLAHARSPLVRPLYRAAVLGLFSVDAALLSQGGRWRSQEIAVWRRPPYDDGS